jgi:Gas vesicle protein
MGVLVLRPAGRRGARVNGTEVALVDLLDRLLAGGVVLTGDLTLAIADVDLVHVSLRALITSIEAGQDR